MGKAVHYFTCSTYVSVSLFDVWQFLMYLLIETIMDHIETNVCDVHLLFFHPFLQTSASLWLWNISCALNLLVTLDVFLFMIKTIFFTFSFKIQKLSQI